MVKQVIVMRKDLNMRKGKCCAQAAHACVLAVIQALSERTGSYMVDDYGRVTVDDESDIKTWFETSYTKICLYVNSEEELLSIKSIADDEGLICSLILDNGTTEFHGEKTYTCLAFEPLKSEIIDPITGHLPLY
jgi:PTH2 family peptidyl-tRNA hydrolase